MLWLQRSGAVGLLLAGWSVSLYALRHLAAHAHTLAVSYTHYVAAYVSIAAVSSFAVCYRRGPPTNTRSLDLIRWTIQVAALALLYCCVQVQAAAVALVIVLITTQCLPSAVLRRAHSAWLVLE